MSLDNPDSRRALRSIVQAVVALAVIGGVGWIIHLLRNDLIGLREIARYALGIVALGTLGYILENVTRAFKLKLGPAEIESAGEAAQSVADAAQDKAGEIKDGG